MRKNIYRMVVVAILLAFAIPLSLSVSAADISSMELTDAEIEAGIEYGPGSDCPLQSPIESRYVWISTVEPVKAKWTVYDPGMHYVTTIEHIPTMKQQITSGEHEGKWAFGDRSSFTLPAFASKGTWLAKCEYVMADGSTMSPPISAETDAIYMGIPCTQPGSWADFFTCPWYFFGWKAPPLIWFPFAFIWIPLLLLGVLLVWTKSISGVVGVFKGAIQAGREAGLRKPTWKRKPKRV